MNSLKPIEHLEDFFIRGPNDKNFLFAIENMFMWEENFFSCGTTHKIVEYSSNDCLNDVKYSYAHGIENI